MERKAPDEVLVAKADFDLLRHGEFEQIQKTLDPSILRDSDISSQLSSMNLMIPAQAPISVKTVWVHVSCSAKTCDTYIILEYRYPSKRILLNTVIRKEDGESTIVGLHVRSISESEMEVNRFTLAGKSIFHYTVLAFAIFAPLISLYSLLLCIRSTVVTKKWLWTVFILIGIGKFWINWTTGQHGFYLFFIQLLSSGFVAEPYGPWMISVSFPVGAFVFLWHRHRLIKMTTKSPCAVDSTNPTEV